MGRRSARKAEVQDSVIKAEESTEVLVASPKKGEVVAIAKIEGVVATVKKASRARSKKVKAEADIEVQTTEAEIQEEASVKIKINRVKAKVIGEGDALKKKPPKKRKAKAEEGEEDDQDKVDTEAADEPKPKKKRKTKEEKEAEAMPLAARTLVASLKKAMHIGAHVSGAGGVHNSVNNAMHIGGNSFALFLKSQRKWVSPPLAPEARDQFKAFCIEHKYDPAKYVLPHGSYLVNLAQPDAERAEQAYACFLDDIQRCEALGIKLYNFHPGNTGPNPRKEAVARIAAQLNKAHKATNTVVTLLENMAGGGNIIGSTWEDLRDIIALIEDKSRIGVCLDTCHAFAAGYDLRTQKAFTETMEQFDSIVGLPYLKALHMNDSKAPLESHRDLHANIGTGFLGLGAFHNVMNYEPFQGLPMVLETPIERKGPDGKDFEDKSVWANEIKLLEGLIGADMQSEEFVKEEQRLQDLGAEDRKKFQGQADKKKQKLIDAMFKKASPKKTKKTKKTKGEETAAGSSESEGCCSH